MIELLSYDFVQLAILCVLVLAGIHAYLGFHVVTRGVIFVDLSLAQMSALGAAFAFVIGFEHGPVNYAISLMFTFAGAYIITIARTRDNRIPQEAFIGIMYAGATALAVLTLSRSPSGAEELQHMIAGSLLTVSPGELIKITVLFAALGSFHYVFRERFLLISRNREEAAAGGLNLIWWDFLFYASFAVVVTTAVTVAGVMLVFSLLVIPPVIALLTTRTLLRRLAVGWVAAFVGAIGGILLSVGMDLPTGPSIIAVLIAILVLVSVVRGLKR